jgi:hypothetical protein
MISLADAHVLAFVQTVLSLGGEHMSTGLPHFVRAALTHLPDARL